MSGTLPGVEYARRRRASHHHQIGPKPSTRRMDRNACYPLGVTDGESSLDENTLKAKRSLEEKLWNLKPSKRGWSKFFCQRNRATTDDPPPETSWREPISSTIIENCRPAILSNQVGAQRDLCSFCLDGFQLQQSVVHLPCIRTASALS